MPPAPEELTAALAESFCSSFTFPSENGKRTTAAAVLPSEDASCISAELIERLGEPAVREFELFIGYPWSLLIFALKNQSVEREQAEQMADSFVSCSDAWKLLLIKSVTQGADQISDVSAGCVGERLSEDDAREVLVLELPASANPLAGVGESCFSAGSVLIVWTRVEDQAPAECMSAGTSAIGLGALRLSWPATWVQIAIASTTGGGS